MATPSSRHATPLAVLRAGTASLQELARANLPRLHALCGELRREAGVADATALRTALNEHMAAARALRFELLIPPGLRAAASRADEAAFRVQVQRVLAATTATWSELRAYAGASGGASARCDMLLSEFVMQARALQRGASHWTTALEQVRSQLGATPGDGVLHAQALEQAGEQLREALLQGQVFGNACEAARNVRQLAHAMEQRRATLHNALHRLAQGLGGGLLERLRPMVAGGLPVTREDIASAEAARAGLGPLLAAANDCLRALDDARDQLLTTLDAMGQLVRPSAWSTTGNAPLAANA